MNKEKTKLLLVDDEVEVLEVLALRLERRGMAVHAVPSAQEALEFLDENEVPIVVMDVKMPEMDGITALQLMKEKHPQIAVIILSGHADMESAAKGLQLGAFSYLLKPVDIDSLCNKIEDAAEHLSLDIIDL